MNNKLNNTNKNLYSTGYSTRGNKTFSYNPKPLNQIKRDSQLSRESNRKYIELMYRKGGFFDYENKKPHLGSYRSYLYNLEQNARSMVPELDFEKNRLMIFNTQCINLRNDQKYNYKTLKDELNTEVDNLQMKLSQNLNGQKVINNKNQNELNELKKEYLDSKNLITELKMRVNALQLRIDGTKMYNSDGIPVLNTKIE